MNYYPFHLGDYAAHTAHLEPMEDLAYRRMLDLYYLRECALPQEPAEIARLIRMRSNVAEVSAVLREFFTNNDGEGWIHTRCEAEISRMQDKQAKAKASAEASVKARQASAQRTLNERSTDVELPTPTPTPNTSVAKATGGTPPAEKSEDAEKRELFDAGKSLLAEQGMPAKQTGSFIGKLAKDYGQQAALEAVRSAVMARPLGAAEYLKATCQRLKGERAEPVTVESTAAAETAAALEADRKREIVPIPDAVKQRIRGALKVVT